MTATPATALNAPAEIPLCGHVSQMREMGLMGLMGTYRFLRDLMGNPAMFNCGRTLCGLIVSIQYIGRIETAGWWAAHLGP
jgi:hypothetical protein